MGFLNKDRLIFDPADMSESDQVGSYLIGADGTVLGNVSDALKVNIENASIVVSATDLDIRDLQFATDSVDVSGSSVSISGSVSVTGSDFDIRDLSSAQDSVEIKTAAGQALSIDGNGNLTVNQGGTWNVNLTDDSVADDAPNSGNPFLVGAVAYDSGLASVSDAGDRVNFASDMFRRLRVFQGAQIAVATSAAVSVGTGAVPLPATPLGGRQKIIVQNTSNNDIFVGDSGVTVSTGIRVAKGSTLELDIGEIVLYAIAGSAGNNVRVFEMA